jgi:hypothetical protein
MATNLEILREQEQVLIAVRETAGEIPGISRYWQKLEEAYARAQISVSRRDELAAVAQESTRQMNADLASGQDALRALRQYLKAELGVYAPELLRYGVKPARQRKGRCRRTPRRPAD